MNRTLLPALLCISLLAVTANSMAEEFIPPVVDDEMRQALRQAMYGPEGFEDHIAAEVWLTDMSNRLKRTLPDSSYRLDLLKIIHAEATRTGLQPELVLAVIQVESNFDRFAISSAGARGLMQVMPFWIKELGHPDDNLFIPQMNLRYGTTILKYYLTIWIRKKVRPARPWHDITAALVKLHTPEKCSMHNGESGLSSKLSITFYGLRFT
jgi:soluble lytic murein transglycosylase-like protein